MRKCYEIAEYGFNAVLAGLFISALWVAAKVSHLLVGDP